MFSKSRAAAEDFDNIQLTFYSGKTLGTEQEAVLTFSQSSLKRMRERMCLSCYCVHELLLAFLICSTSDSRGSCS